MGSHLPSTKVTEAIEKLLGAEQDFLTLAKNFRLYPESKEYFEATAESLRLIRVDLEEVLVRMVQS